MPRAVSYAAACSARAPSNRGNTLNPQCPQAIYLRSVGKHATEKIKKIYDNSPNAQYFIYTILQYFSDFVLKHRKMPKIDFFFLSVSVEVEGWSHFSSREDKKNSEYFFSLRIKENVKCSINLSFVLLYVIYSIIMVKIPLQYL